MTQRVLADVLRDRVAADPDLLAFDDGTSRVTFGELAERAAARARGLVRAGVGSGDRVALTMRAGVPFTEVFWGLQLLGAVPCAFAPGTRDERVAMVRPVLVVDDEAAVGLDVRDGPLPAPAIGPEDLAFIQPTSGTSGAPRGAMVRHRNIRAFLDANHEIGNLRPRDTVVAWVPPWHDLGLVWFVLGVVRHGASCHIVQPAISTIPEWLRTVSRVRADVTAAPDFCYRLAARMVDPATVDLRSLRFAANGGEPPRLSSIEAFEQRFGVPGAVRPGYGLAEATLGVSSLSPGLPLAVDARGNVASGRALPGVEVRAGTDISAPEEILVRAESVFAGYFEAPEETAERLRDGWLHTGDSGYLDDQGQLFVLGRRQGMIKRAGVAIAPRELEEAAQGVRGVGVAAAVGYDAGQGRETIAVIVEADVLDDRAAELIGAVSRAIVDRMGFAPDRVVVAPARTIPRTENGKIRHGRLRDAVADGRVG
ncbi:MAG: AMP-binding protein [Patulibacter sp.]